MENTLENFNLALLDVRKAHRLIYAYQNKILDLIYFIKSKLDFPEFVGQKWFSQPINNKKNGYNKIFHDMWAWDFIYSYMYEYYLGEIPLENGGICALSIFQFSDTGYFEVGEEKFRTDIESFFKPEDSGSKLLFYLEVRSKSAKNWKWNLEEIIYDKKYASISHTRNIINENKNNIQVLYSFPLDNFLNEKTTINALNDFIKYCDQEDVVLFELT